MYSEHDSLKRLERLELLALWSLYEKDVSKIVAITMERKVLHKFILLIQILRKDSEFLRFCWFSCPNNKIIQTQSQR